MSQNTVDYVVSEMRVSGTRRETEINKAIGELVACMYGDKVNKDVVKLVSELKKPVFIYNYEPFEYEDLL